MAANSIARSYDSEILSALKHLEHAQVQTRGAYEPGQWPTNVTAILLPSLVGVGRWGKPYPESTIFTTAAIVSVLHQIEQDGPHYRLLTQRLTQKAYDSYGPFASPPFFNFYPLRKRNGVWVRGPRSLYLAPYFRGLANIPPDADSTSVAYHSLPEKKLPKAVLEAYARFRDLQRKPHSYNANHDVANSGAYLTWLMDEKDPKMPKKFGQPELGPRIPFGTNDVDCIVNANVLTMLTAREKTSTPGYKESCRLIKAAIDKNQYGVCGIYYPSNYLLPLRVAELGELGNSCLQSRHRRVLQYLLETQHPNGSWINSPPNRPDSIQSTALALNALMLLADKDNPEHRRQVRKGIQFLLNHRRKDRQGNDYWKGEVFFSAVAQARYSVVWRSSSYTTVLAARALQLAEEY